MRDIIHPLAGFEVRVIPWADQTTAQNVVINMEGWDWFVVLSADVVINNTGGAVGATGTVFTQFGGLNVMRAVNSLTAGVGATQATFFAVLGGALSLAGVINAVVLPLIINPNASTINIGFFGGDAGTRITKGSVTILGLQRTTNAKR